MLMTLTNTTLMSHTYSNVMLTVAFETMVDRLIIFYFQTMFLPIQWVDTKRNAKSIFRGNGDR